MSSALQLVDRVKVIRARTDRIRRLLWIMTFCKEEPALRRLAFSVQGYGGIAHPALFARSSDTPDNGTMYRLLVDRPVRAGTTLFSLPLPRYEASDKVVKVSARTGRPLGDSADRSLDSTTSAVVAAPQETSAFHSTDPLSPCFGLVQHLARVLDDPNSPQRLYLRFLRLMNNEGGEHSSSAAGPQFHSPLPQGEVHFGDLPFLQDAVGGSGGSSGSFLRGSAQSSLRGVDNGPFLSAGQLSTVRGRAELVKLAREIRTMEQSLPYFCTGNVPWATSMVLSRAFAVPFPPVVPPSAFQVMPAFAFQAEAPQPSSSFFPIVQDPKSHCLVMAPIIDMARHQAVHPTAELKVSVPCKRGNGFGPGDHVKAFQMDRRKSKDHPATDTIGVRGWRSFFSPNAKGVVGHLSPLQSVLHLVAATDLPRLGEVTLDLTQGANQQSSKQLNGHYGNSDRHLHKGKRHEQQALESADAALFRFSPHQHR